MPMPVARVLDHAYPGKPSDRPLIRTFSWWYEAIPARIAEHARPVNIRNGTLWVHTKNAAWAQELSFHAAEMLAAAQRHVPEIARLRFRVGPMPPAPPRPEPEPPKRTPIAATELPAEIARALAALGDDELRNTVTLAACTGLAPDPSKETSE